MSFAADELSERIRSVLGSHPRLSEQKMFGGRAFMLGGHMVVAVMKDGGLLVRVGKHGMADHLGKPGASPMTMGSRTMGGFLQVSGDVLEADEVLAEWLGIAQDCVAALPPK
jgi:TfoX/Sxy family transcriptional regulator of competence genes